MKKLFFFLAVGALALNSCSSSDDDGGGSSGVVLLKKTVETDSDGNTYTSTATYNGTKLNKITGDDGFVVQFFYTGDLITKLEYKESGAVFQTDLYTYSGGKLASYTRLEHDDDYGAKEVYVHNGDGTVSVTAYSGDLNAQTTLDGTGIITFLSNGEVATMINNYSDSHTYTYDNKNNPFKNVTGYSKISWVDADASGMIHNVTFDETNFGDYTTTYTYNANDYPATATEGSGINQYVTTFTYN